MLPDCGHRINLSEHDEFNRAVLNFVTQVEAGRWGRWDARATSQFIAGMEDWRRHEEAGPEWCG